MTVRELIHSFMFAAMEQDIHLDKVCIKVGERYIPLKGWSLVQVQQDNAGIFHDAGKYEGVDSEVQSVVVLVEADDGREHRGQ